MTTHVADPSYSPDVELDHLGRLVFARDVAEGETIAIPLRLLKHAQPSEPKARFSTGGIVLE